jgi:hypothetical protein
VLGISLGTSTAAGYVDATGSIRPWLNELAFAPVDYRVDGPPDEWSGDVGCGVQFFSQQGVARLAPLAGIDLPPDMKLPKPDRGAGTHGQGRPARAPDLRNHRRLLRPCPGPLRRLSTTSPTSSSSAASPAAAAARSSSNRRARSSTRSFPNSPAKMKFHVPGETEKRHGQAMAAASLPVVS